MAKKGKRPSIADLEAALSDGAAIEIMPDGTIRSTRRRRAQKPLTMGRNLGGEYAMITFWRSHHPHPHLLRPWP